MDHTIKKKSEGCSCCCECSRCCGGCDGVDRDEFLLSHWAPVTTRLLEGGGSMAWNIMDHVMMMRQPDFVAQLRGELERSPFLQQLRPARTQGQVQAQEIFSLLHRFTNSSSTSVDDADNGLAKTVEASKEDPPINKLRGDESIFISREDRCQSDFGKSYPHLMKLIQTVETTVMHHLSHCIQFDSNQTSVQLAVYPGDGQSGYPRHCDREFCQEKSSTRATTANPKVNPSSLTPSGPRERIITCVYYLTPDDWDVNVDGGCLRLFHSNNSEWFDVAPYSDRLVVFRSDGVEHQVLPSLRRPRTALTIWLYGSMKRDGLLPITLSSQLPETIVPNGEPRPSTPPSTMNSAIDFVGPPPLVVTSDNSQSKIFVSIAAFRYSETAPTLISLMSTAQHPDRVYVGLVLQVDTTSSNEDQVIMESLQQLERTHLWYNARVRTITVDARHAQGPCYARFLCQSLHRGEDYVLQIDSHMRFRANWDSFLIEQLQACCTQSHNNKVMLTAYPVGYQLPNQIPNETRATLLVPWNFDKEGMLRQQGRLLKESDLRQPIPCHLYAAGFNFSHALVLEDCPYQMLRDLFFGEELSMAVRLYTCGYDLFTPSESVCYHLWSRAHRPTAPLTPHHNRRSSQTTGEMPTPRARSQNMVKEQLAGRGPGLGSERSAADFAKAVKVDFDKRLLDTGADLGNLPLSAFVASKVVVPANELEGAVFSLERNAQEIIASFLQQLM